MSLSSLVASAQFTKRTVTSGAMATPWEVIYGPNDSLWVTEASGYKISRWSLGTTPTQTVLKDLSSFKTWTNTGPQGGLMGLAIHPALYSTDQNVRNAKPWVYVAYVYQKLTPNQTCDASTVGGCLFRTRISRFEYRNNTLINETILYDAMPGSSDHNSGRLVISPSVEPGVGGGLNTQYRLYYAIGDMGAGQLTNTLRTNNAQNQDVLEGKILRINTESDGDAGADQWVPDDNPFYNSSAITPQDWVFSMGHRNPQGLVWGSVAGNVRLYSSEQSDKADDEINVITAGANYGWDKVSGKCDGDVNGFKIGGQNITNEVGNCAGTTEPIFVMFHNNANFPSTYPNNSTASTWPTIALSSITFYNSNKIPGWYGSLLVTPLKEAQVYRLKLNSDGSAVSSSSTLFTDIGGNRLRRVMVAPDGLRFYVIRDGNNSITEYTYTGAISTLPVKLMSFKGSLQNNKTVLNWETAEEINTTYFSIERSIDGVVYNTIGKVDASGNTNVKKAYLFNDIDVANQPTTTVYYRLKMYDKDGEYTYSSVVNVSLLSAGTRVLVSPNPVISDAKVTITVPQEGKAQWKLLDNSGRVVMQGSESLQVGNNQLIINGGSLKAGIYYLRVAGSGIDQQVKIQKL